MHLLLFLQTCALGKCTGISIKTPLRTSHVISKIKKDMKNSLMNLHDKLMLRGKTVFETVNGERKNVCQIEHTRHRPTDNFVTNLIAGLIAYNLLPKKPSMNLEIINKTRLIP